MQDTPLLCLATEEPSFYCLTSGKSSPKRANFCCKNLGQLYRDRRKALHESEQHTVNIIDTYFQKDEQYFGFESEGSLCKTSTSQVLVSYMSYMN